MKTMKTFQLLAILTVFAFAFTSCSDDDDAPQVINEEEVITTMNVMLFDGTSTKMLTIVDADGDPIISADELDANTTYNGSVEFLNETETPVEDITAEVAEEDEEHQVFYVPSSSLNATVEYDDQDANGNPVGLDFTLTTGDASTGTLTVILRHEPNKDAAGVSEGDPANAGGETDVEAAFEVDIL
ncbi:MAG: type 1 periplasmic binding fold superfamily protein [Bacteroidetes bacterium]|nr:type 1 periplasmic binding fold superfamily protein [Bacteroidota bacterium]